MVAQSIDQSSITCLEGKNVAPMKLPTPYFPRNSERPLKQSQNGSTTVEHNKHSLLMQTIGSELGIPSMKFDADPDMQDSWFLQETKIVHLCFLQRWNRVSGPKTISCLTMHYQVLFLHW